MANYATRRKRLFDEDLEKLLEEVRSFWRGWNDELSRSARVRSTMVTMQASGSMQLDSGGR